LIVVPGDETCFDLDGADSADAVAEASGRAGIAFARVAEAVQAAAGEAVTRSKGDKR